MDLTKTLKVSAAGMQAQNARMRTIAENLANADSVAGAPGEDPYRRKMLTFKNALDLQETAKAVPADRLLVETDAPFLAPVPVRGKTCEPAYVAHTARFVAGLRGIDADELTATTTRNFFELFKKAQPSCA